MAIIESNPERQLLKDRVLAIKQEQVEDIIVPNPYGIERRFMDHVKSTKPRHQRDVSHLISIIKSVALLNVWFRRDDKGKVVASQSDIDAGFKIWQKLNKSQEHNLPPYIYEFYNKYILPIYVSKNTGASVTTNGEQGIHRKEIIQRHYQLENRLLNEDTFRRQILPMLETSGLITQEKDPEDKRNKLIFPQIVEPEKYSGEHGGSTNVEQLEA